MLVAVSALKGYDIEAVDGTIGTVSDFLFDDESWNLRWVVVDTGTWLIERTVLVYPSAIKATTYDRHAISVTLSKKQIENSPDIHRDQPVSRQIELSLYDYYGWSPLWGGGGYSGGGAIASPLSLPPMFGQLPADTSDAKVHQPIERDKHLRSIAAVTGYHVHATDGRIGHVENFLIDDGHWDIRYLIVDTRNLWPGNHVLLSPHAVAQTSWNHHEFRLNISREKVESSPKWDHSDGNDEALGKQLHAHYNWPNYSHF